MGLDTLLFNSLVLYQDSVFDTFMKLVDEYIRLSGGRITVEKMLRELSKEVSEICSEEVFKLDKHRGMLF